MNNQEKKKRQNAIVAQQIISSNKTKKLPSRVVRPGTKVSIVHLLTPRSKM